MNMTRKFGIMQYRGSASLNHEHTLMFESDDMAEVKAILAERHALPGSHHALTSSDGLTIVVRGKGGIGDARVAQPHLAARD